MGTLRRNTELGLLILGSVITGGTYTLASLGRTASIPADIGPFLAIVLGLLLAAHVVTRRLAREGDGLLLPIAGLLNGIGYVFIARLNTDLAALQATWTLVGITAYAATLMFVPRIRPLEGYRYTFAAIGMGLLLVPLIPGLGREINGARIWASIGPVNFQPGEFAKIVLALFLAAYLVETRELLAMQTFRVGPLVLPDPRHFGPLALAWGTSLVVMVAEKDLGSSLLFFTLFLVLVWVATERAAYLVAGGSMFAVGAVLAWSRFTHVQSRVDIWLDPWVDPKGAGFQPVEAAFALADGGLTGSGPGLGSPGKIPAAETDFIFAVIGEELGLFGATAILIAFLLMVGSGLRIAVRSEDPFSKLLATGLTTLLGFQAFIIVAGVIRVLPLTGVTLPFVSYGGSSLVANYVLLALLVRISDDSSRRARQRREDQERRVAADELRASDPAGEAAR
ncbi:MAG: FtsW/RodA/SpoVE family cell cycle protein [Actinomycetia bacterium]|nr:FtsW/RodA/SpoVE family cell cycle protein [Actinomycetes bacterium]